MPTVHFAYARMKLKKRMPESTKREELMQKKKEFIVSDPPKRALADAPKERFCLRCKSSFWSEGFGERICSRCKATSAWRAAVPEGVSQGRRSGGRS